MPFFSSLLLFSSVRLSFFVCFFLSEQLFLVYFSFFILVSRIVLSQCFPLCPIVPCCLLFFYFHSVYISFIHSFLCRFYTRTFVLLYMFYDIFPVYDPFDLFFCFFRMIFRFCHRFFIFLHALKVFLRIYASPDTRTRSDRFVPSFPICFANDRLLPYRSDVSLLSFNCRGFFIPIPPCFFLIDALVFFRLCRLSVAFLSAFSSCFGQGSLCSFFVCCTPCFCPFSVSVYLFWIIFFGLSVFQQKSAFLRFSFVLHCFLACF